jgi:hypothetical protein
MKLGLSIRRQIAKDKKRYILFVKNNGHLGRNWTNSVPRPYFIYQTIVNSVLPICKRPGSTAILRAKSVATVPWLRLNQKV